MCRINLHKSSYSGSPCATKIFTLKKLIPVKVKMNLTFRLKIEIVSQNIYSQQKLVGYEKPFSITDRPARELTQATSQCAWGQKIATATECRNWWDARTRRNVYFFWGGRGVGKQLDPRLYLSPADGVGWHQRNILFFCAINSEFTETLSCFNSKRALFSSTAGCRIKMHFGAFVSKETFFASSTMFS